MHLSLKERDILIEGIIQTMKKCEQDIELQEQIFAERMKRRSQNLLKQKQKISELSKSLQEQTEKQPWVFQKCALRGLFLAKECLSRISEDSNTLC